MSFKDPRVKPMDVLSAELQRIVHDLDAIKVRIGDASGLANVIAEMNSSSESGMKPTKAPESAPETANIPVFECGSTYYRKGSTNNKMYVIGTKVGGKDSYNTIIIAPDGSKRSQTIEGAQLRNILGDRVDAEKDEIPRNDWSHWPHVLHIRYTRGGTVDIGVGRDDTILDIKKTIESVRGIKVEDQNLSVHGHILNDREYYTEQGICNWTYPAIFTLWTPREDPF